MEVEPCFDCIFFDGNVINRNNAVKELYVYIDTKFTFTTSKYISSVVFLYNAYVRSHLEYGSTVWNPFEKKKIGYHRKYQKKILRHCNFKNYYLYWSEY